MNFLKMLNFAGVLVQRFPLEHLIDSHSVRAIFYHKTQKCAFLPREVTAFVAPKNMSLRILCFKRSRAKSPAGTAVLPSVLPKRTQLRSWQQISLDNSVPTDVARVFRRSNSGNSLQLVSSCEKTGGTIPDSLGRYESIIQVYRTRLLGVFISLHAVQDAL